MHYTTQSSHVFQIILTIPIISLNYLALIMVTDRVLCEPDLRSTYNLDKRQSSIIYLPTRN